ncbi:MAG: HlyD family secretion protein [Candidatus Andeanibacterium colombiense]|uniref:HlyD family secretion protein n=1 Tax=Candidatus Andeanibacterium colombiense TaxID=3121345 RepID=A0AAJ5X5U3_9SPHN|nr:MAG: HlyD family secretion protein [Sphingomonadaceae bacterium]
MTDVAAEQVDQEEAAEVAAPRVSPLRRKGVQRTLAGVGIVVAVLLAVWFVKYWTVGRFVESTDDAYVQSDAVVVSPKIAGYVDKVLVADNQAVKAGDALFQIDPRDYRSQVAQAQAQIDVAAASAAGLRAQIAEQQATVVGARAQVVSAKSDLELARTIEERYRALSATGAESRETYGDKRRQLANAQAQLALRQSELTSAERRIETLRAQIGQAGAQAEGAKAQRASANVDLSSALVRASIDGRIGNKTVQLGQFVQPGTRAMSIVPVDKLYITANFKETQVGSMRVGQPVKIEIDALGGVELHGKVESFSPGTGAQFSLLPPENATGNFTKIVQRIPVKISVQAGPETKALLVPGMSVSVSVDTRSAKASLQRIEAEQNKLDRAAK